MLDIEAVRASTRIQDVIAFYSGRPLYQNGSPHRLRHHCVFPSHAPDDNPSAETDTLKQLCFCFVCDKGGDVFTLVRERRGCSFREAVRYLADHRWQMPPASILPLARLERGATSKAKRPSLGRWTVYRYFDAKGVERYQILRTPDKQFLFRHRGRDGEWIWNGHSVPRFLYMLDAIQGLRVVFIVEGEKDCNALWRHELPAVTNPGGAGKWRDRYTHQLIAAGVRRVVILPDNDAPGRAHAHVVARTCRTADLETRIVHLPGLPPKGDISDFFSLGRGRRDLLRLLRRHV